MQLKLRAEMAVVLASDFFLLLSPYIASAWAVFIKYFLNDVVILFEDSLFLIVYTLLGNFSLL